ncbi:MAG: heat shock protein DnaJ domain protein [Crocinitomicaceae bacterium]|jgi:DnaJ like chaperone protein|nr:heat shock protein DnaJ domain protein [Crocinitomicaceae bacterium]
MLLSGMYLPGSGQYETFREPEESLPWYLTISAIGLPFVIACSYLLYKYLKNRQWMKGSFPQDLPATTENLLEAYMSLTAGFILLDRYRQMEKVAYLKSFFMRHFHTVPVDIQDSIQRNFHYPIQMESTASWVNNHYSDEHKKQLVRFLVGLSHIDKVLKQKEYDALKHVVSALQLGLSFLDATIHLYREQKNSSKKKTPLQPRISERKKYASILGVDERADIKEIKQRFRELAKKHHPDRFSKGTKEQQQMAHDRFLEIQQAYEYLMGTA